MTLPVFCCCCCLNMPTQGKKNKSGSAWCKWWWKTCHCDIKSADLCPKGCWMIMPLLHTDSAFCSKEKECLILSKFQMLVIYMWHTEDNKCWKEDRGARFPSLDTHDLWGHGWTLGVISREFLFCAAIGICHWFPKIIRNTRRASPGGQSSILASQNQSEKSMKAKGLPGWWVSFESRSTTSL